MDNNERNTNEMNNNDRYNSEKFEQWRLSLQAQTSSSLELAISSGIRKAKKARFRNNVLRSTAAAALVLLIGFSVLVNTSYAFAESIKRIPPLRAVAKLVAMDPTLKSALENDYIQLIGETRETKDGYLSIHYIVADEQQISVFLTEKNVDFTQCSLFDNKTNREILCCWSTGHCGENENDDKPDLFQVTFDISEGYSLSDTLRLDFVLKNNGGTLSFPITLDPKFRNNLKDYPLHKTVNVDGQSILLDKIRISPTKAKLYLQPSKENSGYLKGLTLRLMDEHGKTWNTESNGISGYFNKESTDIAAIMLESTYFSKPKHLQLEISGYEVVPKNQTKCVFDFEKRAFEDLPEFLTVKSISSEKGILRCTFSAKLGKGDIFGQVFNYTFVDSKGKEIELLPQEKHSYGDTAAEFIIPFKDLTMGKGIFTVTNNPLKEISPIIIPIY